MQTVYLSEIQYISTRQHGVTSQQAVFQPVTFVGVLSLKMFLSIIIWLYHLTHGTKYIYVVSKCK